MASLLPEVILLNVRWYYALSYRDLEEMMQERGMEWIIPPESVVLKYAPGGQTVQPHLQPTNDSWRVDETMSSQRKYLYRVVGSMGAR